MNPTALQGPEIAHRMRFSPLGQDRIRVSTKDAAWAERIVRFWKLRCTLLLGDPHRPSSLLRGPYPRPRSTACVRCLGTLSAVLHSTLDHCGTWYITGHQKLNGVGGSIPSGGWGGVDLPIVLRRRLNHGQPPYSTAFVLEPALFRIQDCQRVTAGGGADPADN